MRMSAVRFRLEALRYNVLMAKSSKVEVAPVDRVLGWQSEHDPRSRNYAIRAIIGDKIEPIAKMWQEGDVLDQGSEGACVGFGWTAELLAEPFVPKKKPTVASAETSAISYYHRAQLIDEFPGEAYGTSVLAGAKIMQEDGFIGEYRWCFGVEDLRDAIIAEGPVVIGVPWTDEMYDTLPNGLVKTGGSVVGGHCLTVTGYDPAFKIDGETFEVFRWRNSWGKKYGINGSAYIKYADMSALLSANGEACIPMKRSIPKI